MHVLFRLTMLFNKIITNPKAAADGIKVKTSPKISLDNMDLTDSNIEDYLEHAKTAIAGMSLISVQLQDYLVVMNSKPDVMISKSPERAAYVFAFLIVCLSVC